MAFDNGRQNMKAWCASPSFSSSSLQYTAARPEGYGPGGFVSGFHNTCDDNGEFIRFNRLGDMHLETGVQSTPPVLRSSIGGECDHGGVKTVFVVPFADSPQQAITIFIRHA